MLPLILLLAVPSVYTENFSYIYNGVKYSKQSILSIKGLPTNLVANPNTEDILFTLIDIETLQNDDVQTKMDQYILKNNEPIKIDNVNGQAAAVDIKHNRVYIASDRGLNTLNNTNKANFIALLNEDITQLFKPQNNGKIYAVIYPDSEVYEVDLEKNEKVKVGIPCAFMLAVDNKGNIFYECDSKYVKVLLKDFQEPIEFVGIPKNSARALAVDKNDRVILAANDGLYWLKPNSVIPEKLMNLDFVPSGIAFLDDRFYLSTNGIIYEFEISES
ncbi:unnamed protein product, partial [Brenthis ino]